MIFRDFGIGNTCQSAFDYSQIKANTRKRKRDIIDRDSFYEIELPEGQTSSYIELCIFMTIISYGVDRELTSSEINKQNQLLAFYGKDKFNKLLQIFKNKNQCIAIPLNTDEMRYWKKKTHVLKIYNKTITKLENRKISGKVWRFIGS